MGTWSFPRYRSRIDGVSARLLALGSILVSLS